MSLYGALFSGVSGLQSQSSAMGAISDNVANVNTIGYKGTKVNFQTLVTAQVSLTQYAAGGVQSAPRMNVDIQGLLQATTSSTDFGLSGQGFFVVSDQAIEPSGYAYSRAGSFKIDKDGYLRNVSGHYLQGWPLDVWDDTVTAATVTYNNETFMKSYKNENGETFYINDNAVDAVNMKPLNLNTIGGTARASSSLSLGANLPANALIGKTEKTNALIFDSLGNSHNLLYTWTKRDQNTWDVEAMPPAGSTYASVEAHDGSIYYSAGRLDFTAVPDDNASLDIGGTTYTFTASGGPGTPVDTINSTTYGASLSLLLDGLAQQVNRNTASGLATSPTGFAVPAAVADVTALVADLNTTPQVPADITAEKDALAVAMQPGAAGPPVVPGAADYATAHPDVKSAIDAAVAAAMAAIQSDPAYDPLAQPAVAPYLTAAQNGALAAARAAFGSVADVTGKASPSKWVERISGENGILIRQSSEATAIPVDTTLLTANGGLDSAVLQSGESGNPNAPWTIPALTGPAADWQGSWVTAGTSAITFNGDGTPDTIFGYEETAQNDPSTTMNLGWANGALNMDGGDINSGGSPAISQFWGNYNAADGMQQLSGDYQLNYVTQDGNRFGNYAGITVSDTGIVTALFDNGVQAPIFMIPVATFVNPNGMNALTGNVFQQTDSSGLPVVREAGSAGAATVAQATLESSTVDLGEEFTTMITTQRAYSAASKIITTSDDMLEELLRIKR